MQTDHVTVVWSARENGLGSVRYSTDNGLSRAVTARARTFSVAIVGTFYQYQADLTGLAPGTRYNYQVYVGNDPIELNAFYTFTTPATGAFSFLVMGDSGNASPAQQAVARRLIVDDNINFRIHVCDIPY